MASIVSKAAPKIALVAAASAVLTVMSAPFAAQAQPAELPKDLSGKLLAQSTQPPAEAPDATRTIEQSNSPIGIASGQALMNEAESAIAQQNYTLASEKLVAARKALNDVSTYYQDLSGVFTGVDRRVNDGLRTLALESAQVRDQASYQLAVVYRAQSRPELAVPLLVEVVQSQQPTRPLGQQAYQQLYELGFVSVPYETAGQ